MAQAEAVQGGVHPGVRLVAATLLVRRQQLAVRVEFVRCRGGQRGFRGAHPGFQVTQFGEGRVDGVLDGAARVECGRLAEVAGAAGEGHGDLARVRRLGPGQQPEQRGLAGAVLSDDAGLLAGAHGQ